MRHLHLILLLLPVLVFSESGYYNAYVNKVEDTDLVTVFTMPGLNTRNCVKVKDANGRERCRDAIGWLDRNSKVRIVDGSKPQTIRVLDPSTHEAVWVDEEFIEVDYSYTRLGADGKWHPNKKRGFVEKKHISNKPVTPFYSEKDESQVAPSPKPSPVPQPAKTSKDCSATATSAQLKDIQNLCRPLADSFGKNIGVNKTAEALSEVVGHCAVWPPTKFPKNLPQGNIYDRIVYPILVKNKGKIPVLKNEAGKNITLQEVSSIDALARTLYGEMGRCYSQGLHYPVAIAKIIVNRANAPQYHKTFIKGPHHPHKSTLAKVATTPVQFKMWNTKDGEGKSVTSGPLHHGLCPPRKLGEPFYGNKVAPKYENDIWVHTMRIATEAVLFPKKFAERTKNLTELHYTSGLAKFRGTDQLSPGARHIEKMTQVHPEINERTIDYDPCVEIWRE